MAYNSSGIHKGFIVGSSSTSSFKSLSVAIDAVPSGSVLYLEKGLYGHGETLAINKKLTITSFDGASTNDSVTVDHAFDFYEDITISNIKLLLRTTDNTHHSGNVSILRCWIEKSYVTTLVVDDFSSNGDFLFQDCLFSDTTPIINQLFQKNNGSTSTLSFVRCTRPPNEIYGIVNVSTNTSDGLLVIEDSIMPFCFATHTNGLVRVQRSVIGNPLTSKSAFYFAYPAATESSIADSRLLSGENNSVLLISSPNIKITNTHCIRNSTDELADVLTGAGTLRAANLYFGIPKGIAPGLTVEPIYVFPRDAP